MKSSFLRKAIIMVLIAALLCTGVYAAGATFPDVPDTHWANPAVEAIAAGGLVQGYENGEFRPKNSITVAELAVIIGRATGFTDDATAAYWAAPSIEYCIEDIKCLPDMGEAIPANYNIPCPRELAVYMLVNGVGTNNPSAAKPDFTADMIPDYDQCDDAYKAAVLKAYELGLVQGMDSKHTFAPKSTFTRAEMATIFYNANILSPGEPVTPEEPTEPEIPAVPEEPEEPSEPEIPVVPEEPDEPEEPTEPETPVIPDKPEEPTEPEIPVVPEEPEVPIQPDEPYETGLTNLETFNLLVEDKDGYWKERLDFVGEWYEGKDGFYDITRLESDSKYYAYFNTPYLKGTINWYKDDNRITFRMTEDTTLAPDWDTNVDIYGNPLTEELIANNYFNEDGVYVKRGAYNLYARQLFRDFFIAILGEYYGMEAYENMKEVFLGQSYDIYYGDPSSIEWLNGRYVIMGLTNGYYPVRSPEFSVTIYDIGVTDFDKDKNRVMYNFINGVEHSYEDVVYEGAFGADRFYTANELDKW